MKGTDEAVVVWCDVKLAEALAPLLRAMGLGRVSEECCQVDQTNAENGVGAVNEGGFVDKGGQCVV